MAYSRYSRREIFLNNSKEYRKVFFKNRDVQQVFQYDTPKIVYPDGAEIQSLTNIPRTWAATDKLYNLANEYYGSPTYWWVIPWYNQKASESEFTIGEVYYIPLPLEDVLGYIR